MSGAFHTLMVNIRRKRAEFDFELSITADPYRLDYLLKEYAKSMENFHSEAQEMVFELEELDNG